jgi:cytochrome c-type biogenesis protein CcmH/NrfG
MIMIVALIELAFGLSLVIRGKATPDYKAQGISARIAGLILITPMLVTVIIMLVSETAWQEDPFKTYFMITQTLLVIVCGFGSYRLLKSPPQTLIDLDGKVSNLFNEKFKAKQRRQPVISQREQVAKSFGLGSNPQANTHSLMGMTHYQSGLINEAIQEFKIAIQLDPDFAAAHYNLGNILLKQGNYEAAASELTEAIRSDPNLAEAHVDLSMIYAIQGKAEEATNEMNIAAELGDVNAKKLISL